MTGCAKTCIIAEVGINHNGSVPSGMRLIDASLDAGADYVKFQMRDLPTLYRDSTNYTDEGLSTQYVLDLLNKFELNTEELIELFDYAKWRGIEPLCTPWDVESVDILERYGMPTYKIASADLTNHELLRYIAKTKKPIICSTGMSTEQEIVKTCDLLNDLNVDYKLLHCNSSYPAPYKDINLNYMSRLKDISGGRPVGYSGHEKGWAVPLAAVAMGACVIEKHITLDRDQEGSDHKVSLLPSEFSEMVKDIRNIELSFGDSGPRKVTQGELINRDGLAKSIVAKHDMCAGTVVSKDMLEIKSPGGGLQPIDLDMVVGRNLNRDVSKGGFLLPCDINDNEVEMFRSFKIEQEWGIPVRFHDYDFFLNNTNPKFLEFHLSYKDLNLNPTEFFKEKYDIGLVVHSPDLFEDDHLVDLASTDKYYRNKSIDNVRRVVDITKEMQRFFNTQKTLIVVSVGGTTRDRWMSEEDKKNGYRNVANCLSELADPSVEFVIQTLPPFPWYFGGQLKLNLFVLPDEIKSFCEQHGHRLCLDTSHSQLACNYYNLDFVEFVSNVGKHVAHAHFSDAHGLDDEGLQIGEGQIDFSVLYKYLSDNVSFIPEIWQGHKNAGCEMWKALSKLEKIFSTDAH